MEHLDARFDEILEVIQDIRVVIQDIRVATQDIRVAIRAEVQGVQRKLCVNQDRDFACTLNLNMPRVSTVLMALPREDGELPPGFPETHDAFKNLNGEQVDALLAAYEQPLHGSVEERRLRLAYFIGLPYD
ncbi:hypothetical protein FRC08_015666 [Ceratobasidium sp. 394]|nr:hypothetical protein FRC08_015666 [Ceratobasidium sp. 394]